MSDTETLPKRVTLRVPLRDYKRMVQISIIAENIKSSKEGRKVLQDIIQSDENIDLSLDVFLNLLIRLPMSEVNITRPFIRRNPPKAIYFVDPKPTTPAVKLLYHTVKEKEFTTQLRHDQLTMTCPSDVRAMFYVYIHSHNLIKEDTKEIIIDKFIKKLAPKTTKNLTTILRKDVSTIWKICSEIRDEK